MKLDQLKESLFRHLNYINMKDADFDILVSMKKEEMDELNADLYNQVNVDCGTVHSPDEKYTFIAIHLPQFEKAFMIKEDDANYISYRLKNINNVFLYITR